MVMSNKMGVGGDCDGGCSDGKTSYSGSGDCDSGREENGRVSFMVR